MLRKFLAITLMILVSVMLTNSTTQVLAATEGEIEQAIGLGVNWLVGQQNLDPGDPDYGSWGQWEKVAMTSFALVILEDRAIHLGYSSPFDQGYPFRENVEKGLDYLLKSADAVDIGWQPAGNPDSDGDGTGVYFAWELREGEEQLEEGEEYRIYNTSTSVAMMAIAASRDPDRSVTTGPLEGWTYEEVLQDAVDYLAFAQNDYPPGRGGWGRGENSQWQDTDGSWYSWSENLSTGYAILGIGYAETFSGCAVPQFVRNELNVWIDYIQNDVDGDPGDGGSGYDYPDDWVNILNTGCLLLQTEFVGDTPTTQRVIDAIDYIERTWDDPSADPGWRGWPGQPVHKQAMYCITEGLEALGIQTITVDDVERNWYDEFADALIAQQQLPDGNWEWDEWGGDELSGTEWAILTLEKGLRQSGSSMRRLNHIGRFKEVVVSLAFSAPDAYPNPFNPDVWIPYTLGEGVEVKITIRNASGQSIRILHLGYREPGIYISKDKAAYWDGCNESGERVSSGVYFYTIQAGDFIATKKLLLAK